MKTTLPTLQITTLDGSTPKGRTFTLETTWDTETGKETRRRLQWHAFGEVGPVGVPMYPQCWYGQLYFELTRNGTVCDETARNCFMTYEGGQNVSKMPSFAE